MPARPPAELVESHLWIVEHFHARYRLIAPAGADLRAAGRHGLCEAAAKFQPKKGRVFSTYAWKWVKGYVLAELRKCHVVAVPEHSVRQAQAAGSPVRGVVVFGVPEIQAEEEAEAKSDRAMRLRSLRSTIAELDEPARSVVRRALRGLTIAQIASQLRLTQARVAELLEQAERELQELMR